MTHPAWDDERELLLSPQWAELRAGLPSGAFAPPG